MAHTVFISHAHKDNEVCDRYAKQLKEWGLDVWYDRDNMEFAQVISETIGRELKQRTALVVLLTPNAVASKWVGLEVSAYLKLWADEGGTRKIVPVLLQECELPPLLGLFNYIDAATLLDEDDAMRAIAHTLGIEPPAPPPAPPEPSVTTPLTKLTVTPDQAVQLLDGVTRMLQDWYTFSEEKWRAVSDSQLGWKPLRGRWNGWDEIFEDRQIEPDAQAPTIESEGIRTRHERAREKGSAASAVACFLNDLNALRLSIHAIYGAGNDPIGDLKASPRPSRGTTTRGPVIRNPMIVDADDVGYGGYDGYSAWDDDDLARALVPPLPRRAPTGRQPAVGVPVRRTGKQAALTPAIAARRVLPAPTPTSTPDAAPPRRGWRWPWQRTKR